MTYLFFDCEFASTKKNVYRMCELGYILVDHNFNTIYKGNFIINPSLKRNEWDYRVVKKILNKRIELYEKKPTFDKYYDNIKDLFNKADYVIGHTIYHDVFGLNQECERYNCQSIDCNFYDLVEFYKKLTNNPKATSLKNMLNDLNMVFKGSEHSADCDAFNTMLVFKVMLKTFNITIDELIVNVPSAKGVTLNYKVELRPGENNTKGNGVRTRKTTKKYDGTNRMTQFGDNKKIYLDFLDNQEINKSDGLSLLNKKITISINYEENHFKQILNLVKLINANGGEVILKASLSDIFVKYDEILEDGKIRRDSRLEYVKEANANGSNIKIIELDEFLSYINITKKELDNMPLLINNAL